MEMEKKKEFLLTLLSQGYESRELKNGIAIIIDKASENQLKSLLEITSQIVNQRAIRPDAMYVLATELQILILSHLPTPLIEERFADLLISLEHTNKLFLDISGTICNDIKKIGYRMILEVISEWTLNDVEKKVKIINYCKAILSDEMPWREHFQNMLALIEIAELSIEDLKKEQKYLLFCSGSSNSFVSQRAKALLAKLPKNKRPNYKQISRQGQKIASSFFEHFK